jgi:predicted RNA binding protein YcfA (HicA-like mRNA interferase family)
MKGVYKNSLRIFPVPQHKELKKGTLTGIIRQAGMTLEEFREFM